MAKVDTMEKSTNSWANKEKTEKPAREKFQYKLAK